MRCEQSTRKESKSTAARGTPPPTRLPHATPHRVDSTVDLQTGAVVATLRGAWLEVPPAAGQEGAQVTLSSAHAGGDGRARASGQRSSGLPFRKLLPGTKKGCEPVHQPESNVICTRSQTPRRATTHDGLFVASVRTLGDGRRTVTKASDALVPATACPPIEDATTAVSE